MGMTIRDVAIAFGYEIDSASEGAVNKSVNALKETASNALNSVPVGYSPDTASEQAAHDSVNAIKQNAKPLEKNKISYQVDQASMKSAMGNMRKLKYFAVRILRGLGIGASIMGAFQMAKKFIAQNADMQEAVKEINEEWTAWKKEVSETYSVSKDLAKAMLKGFKEIMKIVRRATDGFAKLAKKVGGVGNVMKLLAIIAGSIIVAMKHELILSFIKKLTTGITTLNAKLALTALKTMAIFAVVVLLALIVDDFLAFMRNEDSIIGLVFEKLGISADDARKMIGNAWDKIKGYATIALGKIKETATKVLGWLGVFWDRWGSDIIIIFMFLERSIKNAFDRISAIFEIFSALFRGDWEGLWGGVKDYFSATWEQIKNVVTTAMDILYDVFGPWLALIAGITTAVLVYQGVMLATQIGTLKFAAAQKLLAIRTAVLTGVQKLAAFATGGMAAAQALLNAVMLLNPIVLIIALIAGLVVAFLILWNKSDKFREFFLGLWEKIKEAVGVAATWIGEKFEAMKGLFESIKTAFGSVHDYFKEKLDAIVTFFQPLLDIIGTVKDFLSGGLMEKGKELLTKIRIPGFAGGSNKTPSAFIAGEKGPELVTGAKDSKVFTALQTGDIFQALKDIANLAARPSADAASAMSSTIENKSIVLNVTMSNQFNGDRAGQQKSAEAMDKASNDMFGQLSRALSYAR